MNIKVEDIIGLYLAKMEEDLPRIDEVILKINALCENISKETDFFIEKILSTDIAAFTYRYEWYAKLKKSGDGFNRVLVTGNEMKREEMIKYFLSRIPKELHKYFVKQEPTFIKKNN